MARRAKKKTVSQIIDSICEMEAYIEYLEDKLKNHWSYDRKQDKARLGAAKLRFSRLRVQLNEA